MEYSYNYMRRDDEKKIYAQFEKNYLKENLEVEILNKGYVLPQKESMDAHNWMGIGGALNQNKEFVRLSGIEGFAENEGFLVFGGGYSFDEADYVDEEVLYMGAFQPHWGHFLLEYITRLWYLEQCTPNIKIAYCGFACEPNSISGNYLQLLELLGIKKEQLIDVRKPTQFKSIIVPQQGYLRGKYYSNEFKKMLSGIKKRVREVSGELTPIENIYFTRTGFVEESANDKERGELEIKVLFEQNNYTAMAPEKLSALEQIYYVSNCKRLVVPVGGASMNALFLSSDAECVFLKKAYLPDTPADLHIISQMNEFKKTIFLDAYYKPFKKLPISYGGGPHLLGLTPEIWAFAEDNGMTMKSPIHYKRALVKNYMWLTYMRFRKSPEIKKIYNLTIGKRKRK